MGFLGAADLREVPALRVSWSHKSRRHRAGAEFCIVLGGCGFARQPIGFLTTILAIETHTAIAGSGAESVRSVKTSKISYASIGLDIRAIL